MLLASAVPVSVSVLSLVMPSPTVPLSVENEAMRRRCRRRRVDRHGQRRRRHPGIAGRIGRRRRQVVRTIRQRRRGIAPGPAAVGHRAAQQRRAVKNLDRALASAVPVSVSVASLVMWSPTVPLSVENEAMVGATGAVVSIVTASAAEAALVLAAASLAVAVRLCAPFASAAVV